MKRTSEECRSSIIEYVKKHNNATVDEIEGKLKVNVHRLFGGIKKAFKEAEVVYPRNNNETIEKAVNDLKRNPLLTVDEIQKKYNFSLYKRFKSFKIFCDKYQLKFLAKHKKRLLKKQLDIIDYIKEHPNSTQWEINKNCHTHVQDIFGDGIFEAFKKAGIEYPSFRRKIFGSANRQIRNRAIRFEKSIFKKLEKVGNLKRYVETESGIVDGVLEIRNRRFVIEIKNYLSKPISKTELTQLAKYMKSLNYSNGILICNKKGNKDKIQIDSCNILIVTKNELGGLWSNLAKTC